jgi:hypothetical protein
MGALLGKGRAINYPRLQAPLREDLGQTEIPDGIQHGLVVPGGIRDEALEREELSLDVFRIYACGHGLHAFSLSRKQESETVPTHRLGGTAPSRRSQGSGKAIRIGVQSCFPSCIQVHPNPP